MKYRLKPIEFDAWQLPPADDTECPPPPQWLMQALMEGAVRAQGSPPALLIMTPDEGTDHEVAVPGDWILRCPNGELTACAAQTIHDLYEPVELQAGAAGSEA